MNKKIEKILKILNEVYPFRFTDSYTGVMTRGVIEPWGVRMIKPEEKAMLDKLIEVVNSLIKDEESKEPKGKTK